MATQKLHIKFDTTKLKEFHDKLKSFNMNDVHKSASSELTKESLLDELSIMAQNVIWQEIYMAYDPKRYDRTYELMESFSAVASSGDTPGIRIISVDYAAIKWGKYEGKYSYAAFFEGKWDSFIPPQAKPVRPFMSILTRALHERMKPEIAAIYKEEIKKKLKV